MDQCGSERAREGGVSVDIASTGVPLSRAGARTGDYADWEMEGSP
ncbi:hypothetical protein PS854_00934 [Pseudomonas fluorescens]|uniref:Uncharacterized protein n=1 Tax=Pseudomonas fluorescens TaxID=294 RepID=A0A5E7HHJ8_PSEFL|nr:hypothetical protein PS854_00934 [Pseudomonas fluorescens]